MGIAMYIFLFLFLMLHLAADLIEEKVKNHWEKEKIPGMCVVVIEGGISKIYNVGVADLRTKRPVTQDTLFEIASITKVFTGTAVAACVLNGKMNLDVPMIRYLPQLRERPVEDLKQVTLGHLLTHTASLPRIPPPLKGGRHYTRPQVFQFLARWKAHHAIGTKYLYSNLSFGVAGYALEGVMDQPLIDIYREFILTPLGMNHTVIRLTPALQPLFARGTKRSGEAIGGTPVNAWPAGGALISSGGDMEKFLAANMGIQTPPKLWEAMLLAQKPRFSVETGLKLGLGWQNRLVNGVRRLDKNGGLPGFSSYIGFYPDLKVGVVVLANRAESQTTALGRELLELMKKKSRKEKLSPTPEMNPAKN